MKSKLIAFFLLSATALAQNLSQSFPAGSGAKYKIKMGDSSPAITLNMYVAGTRVDSVHVEYFMEVKDGLLTTQLWQQFEVGVSEQGAQVRKGYVLSKEMTQPETMPAEYLRGAADGIQVNDFLFSNPAKLAKDKIGEETLEIAAGTTKATHYRTQNNGQIVDYWISPDAKPMGLVLLISKNPNVSSQNYAVELLSLSQNVKAKIIPEKAVPLSEKGKSFLARPSSLR